MLLWFPVVCPQIICSSLLITVRSSSALVSSGFGSELKIPRSSFCGAGFSSQNFSQIVLDQRLVEVLERFHWLGISILRILLTCRSINMTGYPFLNSILAPNKDRFSLPLTPKLFHTINGFWNLQVALLSRGTISSWWHDWYFKASNSSLARFSSSLTGSCAGGGGGVQNRNHGSGQGTVEKITLPSPNSMAWDSPIYSTATLPKI